ncbi:MAG: CoA-binding protein [Bacteroidota bacterium]
MKRTAILGATSNPNRYAFIAAQMLVDHGHEIVPIGIKKGQVAGTDIMDLRQKPGVGRVDTVTLYLGPQNQPEWYDYIIGLNPKRIIFNPGTENFELQQLATKAGIETEEACTLVLLRIGSY